MMNKTATLLALLVGATACDMEGLSTEGDDVAADVGETSQEIYDPAAPPTAVATDACDDSTYPGVAWSSSSSEHITVYYLAGTAAERDIATILAQREQAYGAIRTALGITATPTISVYLSPNRLAAVAKSRGLGTAFPGQDRYEAIYTGAADSFEVKQLGHLLTRTLEYHVDQANAKRVPFFSAGVAEALDQSGRNLHDAYALRLRAGIENRTQLATFEASDLTGRNTGRAGSLVKFLIDRYGMTAFVNMFKATAVSSVSGCSTRSATYGCINSATALTSMIDGVLFAQTGERWADVAPLWKAEVQARLATVKDRLSAADNAAITNLVNLMDQAIVTGDAATYRSTMEGFYCEWGGEAGRQDIAQRTIDAYQGSTSYVRAIYASGTQNFQTARILVHRLDERRRVSFHTLSAERFPEGWRISYGPDWF